MVLLGGYDYKFLNNFVSMGAMFMTGFFMLSGFVVSYSYQNDSLIKKNSLKYFYIKRMVSIYPLYWLYGSYRTIIQGDTLITNIMMFPIEALGLQSVWHGLFNYGHNNGTWFISCLLFCYVLFPFINEVLSQICIREKITIFLFCFLVSIYTPFLCKITGFDFIYSNYHDCVFRCIEFFLGCILFSMINSINKLHFVNSIKNWFAFIIELIILIIVVSMGVNFKIGIYDYNLYSVVGIPMFCIMFITLYEIEITAPLIKKLIKYLSDISYAFYLMQYFAWSYTPRILNYFSIDNNINRIILSFALCIGISTMVHYFFEKPVSKKCINIFKDKK